MNSLAPRHGARLLAPRSVRGIDLTIPRRSLWAFDRYLEPVISYRPCSRGAFDTAARGGRVVRYLAAPLMSWATKGPSTFTHSLLSL